MTELEPRVQTTYGSGTKSFLSIDGFTLKDKPNPQNPEDIRTIRGQLAHTEWMEASPGKDLFYPCVIAAYLHFIDLVANNPDYLWHYIHYRKDNDARKNDLPTT